MTPDNENIKTGADSPVPRTPVLIVGAGPAGLAASLLLQQYGVPALTITRHGWTAHTPRAHHINPRAMELLRGLGLEEAVRRAAHPNDLIRNVVWCVTLAGDELGRLVWRQQSTIDLVAGGAFHLLTGPGGEAWSAVCNEIARRTGVDITVTAIGPGCPFGDPYGEWQRIRGISDTGALLVRPDGHVAWRAETAGEEQFQALRTAVASLLGHDAAPNAHEDRLETVAG